MTYDSKSDRAYIWLRDFEEGEDSRQYTATGPHFRGIFVLDFDRDGRLLGIEVIGARDGLTEGALERRAGRSPDGLTLSGVSHEPPAEPGFARREPHSAWSRR